MKRQTDLTMYLPEFMGSYRESEEALRAENPEFTLVWSAADGILYNHFISTADEYGIGRFEKLLKICPEPEDTLEGRRNRVQNRWINIMPYTIRVLTQKLCVICEDTDFVLRKDFEEGYTLMLDTNLEGFGKVQEVEETIAAMVPCNIKVIGRNEIFLHMGGKSFFTGVVAFSEVLTIIS